MTQEKSTTIFLKILQFFSSMIKMDAQNPWESRDKASFPEIFRRSFSVILVMAIVLGVIYWQLQRNYSFNWGVFIGYLPDFFRGFVLTLKISITALIFSLVFGVIFGIARVSNRILFSDLAVTYVEGVRNIPLLVIVLLVYFGFGSVFEISRFFAGVFALTIFQSAYIAEIIRAGIQSVGRGQVWASRSLGLSSGVTMRYIIIPQVLRRIIPALAGQLIYLIQGSSLCSVISLTELTLTARRVLTITYSSMECYFTLTLFYFVTCALLSLGTKLLEKRLRVE